jgi:hypothetical protein
LAQPYLRTLSAAILAVVPLTCSGRAEDKPFSDKQLTCAVYGGSFVLDENDFKALTQEKLGGDKVSKERFASLKPDAPLRTFVCDTRKLWRLARDKKATIDDFADHYKALWPSYLTEAERKTVLDAQIDAAANNWR